ncbi:hypothetical protein QBC43DRAFT_338099 [Cladorrhinum sp. PSN259]|nr:hypothetical protein QBC43DRAFT_338099 [Cladorrhinum sp. PSN259]
MHLKTFLVLPLTVLQVTAAPPAPTLPERDVVQPRDSFWFYAPIFTGGSCLTSWGNNCRFTCQTNIREEGVHNCDGSKLTTEIKRFGITDHLTPTWHLAGEPTTGFLQAESGILVDHNHENFPFEDFGRRRT